MKGIGLVLTERKQGASLATLPIVGRAIRAVRRALRWRLRWVQGDYRVCRGGTAYAYQSIIRNQAYAPWNADIEFLKVYELARANTLVDIVRCYELWDLVQNLREVPGAILEVGVWRGGTAAILACALAHTKPRESIYLCDTFRGVVKAGAYDSTYKGGEHADTSQESVRSLLRLLSISNAVLLEGMFPEDTAARIPSGAIALCHIDVDVYQSARDTVEWVEPRLSTGGALVFDDYGFPTCTGVTRLVHELKATRLWTAIYNLNGHAILIKR
jgi:O-methyltransferase